MRALELKDERKDLTVVNCGKFAEAEMWDQFSCRCLFLRKHMKVRERIIIITTYLLQLLT